MDVKSKYTKKLTEELWCDESTSLFYYKFQDLDKYVEGTLDFSQKSWNTDMKISVAKATLLKEKNKNKQLVKKEQVIFDTFIKKNFKFYDISDLIEQKYYKKYIKPYVGNLTLDSITVEDIKKVLYNTQYSISLSTYQINFDFLLRVFDLAVQKNLIVTNPCRDIEFQYAKETQLIKVLNNKITEIYEVVNIIFHNKPLIVSFFLFLLYGKKGKKILELKWELIDFQNNSYRLENKISKRYYLQPSIKEELLKVRKQYGYVYQNDVDSNKNVKIPSIVEESYKINEYIPEFSIKLLESLVEELKEREIFGEEINLEKEFANLKLKQIPQKQIIKPKLNIGKFSKKT